MAIYFIYFFLGTFKIRNVEKNYEKWIFFTWQHDVLFQFGGKTNSPAYSCNRPHGINVDTPET